MEMIDFHTSRLKFNSTVLTIGFPS